MTKSEIAKSNIAVRRSSSNPGKILFLMFAYAVLFCWLLLAVTPFVWTFLTSIKQVIDAFSIPPVWTFTPTFEAYQSLWIEEGFVKYLINSVIVSVGTVTISISIGCLAGYALSRYNRPAGFWILFAAFVFRALPRMTFLLPFFFFARITGTFDTHILLILVLVAINQPFTIWMLRSFFQEIPESLEESAMIDGCTRFQAFWYVILPVMGPGVVTASIFVAAGLQRVPDPVDLDRHQRRADAGGDCAVRGRGFALLEHLGRRCGQHCRADCDSDFVFATVFDQGFDGRCGQGLMDLRIGLGSWAREYGWRTLGGNSTRN
jgi:ABC-type glycerol-3-phosphate transport system permease component